MVRFAFFSLLILLPFCLAAQFDTPRQWHDGPLEWHDFQLKDYEALSASEFNFFISYRPKRMKSGDTVVQQYEALAWMDRSKSWVNPGQRTDELLRYNQVLFNLVEVSRRILQYELDRLESWWLLEEKLHAAYRMSHQRIRDFQQESGYGRKPEVLDYWEGLVQNELKSLPADSRPEYEKRNFGYGIFWGFGYRMAAGEMARTLSNRVALDYGFDFSYKRLVLTLSGMLSAGRLQASLPEPPHWNQDTMLSCVLGYVSLGYRLREEHRFKITPFVGIGGGGFSLAQSKDEEKAGSLNSFSVTGGVNFDYVLRHRITRMPDPLFSSRELGSSVLRTRVYVSTFDASKEFSGLMMNVSVSYMLGGRFIRPKEPSFDR